MRRPTQRRDRRQEQLEMDEESVARRQRQREKVLEALPNTPTGEDWTQEDVEHMAQVFMADGLPVPDAVHDKLGPCPPDAFLEALGHRIMELQAETEARATDG
jgi:bifunctional pyridoxal-dependent enzyme with beta-cystathionase and maltose regulon repressor activities